MVEVDIGRAVEKTESETNKLRLEGLEDLRRLFVQSKGTQKLGSLGDEGYHRIFEGVFRIVRIEKPAYVRATKSARNVVTSRLEACAAVLRLAVEAGVGRIRSRTAIAVIDHIIETLPLEAEGLCIPLRNDYLKSLRAILEYAPIGEHLRQRHWEALCDFLVTGLNTNASEDPLRSTTSSRQTTSQESHNSYHVSLRFSQVSGSRGQASDTAGFAEELIVSLKLITAITNSPLMTRANAIFGSMITYLATATKAQSDAILAFNNALARTITEDISLSRRALFDFLPIIRRLWSVKSALVKDQILITLILGKETLASSDAITTMSNDFSSLDNVFEAILTEYRRRLERDMLHLEDCRFLMHDNVVGVSLTGLAPAYESPRALSCWTVVWALSFLARVLDDHQARESGRAIVSGTAAKKLRLSLRSEGTIDQVMTTTGSERLCAVQMLAMLLEKSIDVQNKCAEELPRLASKLMEDDSVIVSWVMLSIARFARTKAAKRDWLGSTWSDIWKRSITLLSTPGTSRMASHLLEAILEHELLDTHVQADFMSGASFAEASINSHVLTDGTLALWLRVLRMKEQESLDSFHKITMRFVNWLSVSWPTASLVDRAQNAQVALQASPGVLFELLARSVRQNISVESSPFFLATSPIFPALLAKSRNIDLIEFLNNEKFPEEFVNETVLITLSDIQTRDTEAEHAILELLRSKLRVTLDQWAGPLVEVTSSVNSETFQIITTLCVISAIFSGLWSTSIPSLSKTICTLVNQLWKLTCAFVSHQVEPHLEIYLMTATSSLLSIKVIDFNSRHEVNGALVDLAKPVSDLLKEFLRKDSNGTQVQLDSMDIDDSFLSQNSQTKTGPFNNRGVRQDISYLEDRGSVLARMAFDLYSMQLLTEKAGGYDAPTCSSLVDYITSFSAADLLALRQPAVSFVAGAAGLTRHDAARLLEHLAASFLQDENFERCESALCFCLDVMTASSSLWATGEEDDLSATTLDMYEWFLEVAVGKGLASARLLQCIAVMLESVLNANVDFHQSTSTRSPRTSLFRILQAGDNSVKFHAVPQLCGILNRFVLTEHEAILDDIIESLPADVNHVEGIAVRLFLLTQLASHMSTLLRTCIYHIFEISARTKESITYALHSLQRLCKVLGLSSPKDIFVMFKSQLFYTWLETGKLDNVPYAIFAYANLKDLLEEAQDSLVGQICMRASTQHAEDLSRLLGVSWSDLVHGSFAIAEAYTVARDISMPRCEDRPKSTESLLRKQLGTEMYLTLIQQHFPEIVATLLRSCSDEDGIEKAFAKRQGFEIAKATHAEILQYSRSQIRLPTGLQPSFRARFLLDELAYICQRIDVDLHAMWSPPLFTYVGRSLFDSSLSALGPLHACSVLRRTRILVSIAGSCALHGYPLDMLLHTIRPFLTVFNCSEDALGLFKYLLVKGKAYLSSQLPTLTGTALSTFIALAAFLNSPQESTTQESHFLDTMTKAQSFRDWFSSYLNSLDVPGDEVQHREEIFGMIQAARGIAQGGSAIKGSPAADLMLALLDDRTSTRRVLSESAYKIILELLCQHWETPATPRDDVLGDDTLAILHAPALWNIVLRYKVGQDFLVWASNVLGRAYAATGLIVDDLHQEQQQESTKSSPNGQNEDNSSDALIFDNLYEMLLSEDPMAAGQAEKMLQIIITMLSEHGSMTQHLKHIPTSLAADLRWTSFPVPASKSSATICPAIETVTWGPEMSLENWTSQLSIALCIEQRHDPILSSLPSILDAQPHFAVRTMPSITHKALLMDPTGKVRQVLSRLFGNILRHAPEASREHVDFVNRVVLGLRAKPRPREITTADRNSWLEIDFVEAADAASTHGSQKIALLYMEMFASERHLQNIRTSRRSSIPTVNLPADLVQSIFQQIDDPDFFYGLQEQTSFESILKRLNHESEGFRTVSFQNARYDSDLRSSAHLSKEANTSDLVVALAQANLNGLARAVSKSSMLSGAVSSDTALSIALSLHEWDLPSIDLGRKSGTNTSKALRQLGMLHSRQSVSAVIDPSMLKVVQHISGQRLPAADLQFAMNTLGMLTEIKDMLVLQSKDELDEQWKTMKARTHWMEYASFEKVNFMLLGREELASAIRRNVALQRILRMTSGDSETFEAMVVRQSLQVLQSHGASQASLNRAVYLLELSKTSEFSQEEIRSVAHHDLAKILWDQGETSASVQIFRQLSNARKIQEGTSSMTKAGILADLGHRLAEARLEKPDEIIVNYLAPAIKELHGHSQGSEAGRVFHEFAAFCDAQLQNTDRKDEFSRIENIRQRKLEEVADLEEMMKKEDVKGRDLLKSHHSKAKQWVKLDEEEYRRLKDARDNLVQNSLENYLLSMRACNDYKNDVLRFCALWLAQDSNKIANAAVARHISKVPSLRFAPLMSQLISRILNQDVEFQLLLFELLVRICCEHPYHGMYHVFVTSKTRGASSDEIATSRFTAARKVGDKLMGLASARDYWIAIHNSSIAFVNVANERLEDKKYKPGVKVSLRDLKQGPTLEQAFSQSAKQIAPPTMKIALRTDSDYSSIPTYCNFEPQLTIAGGVSKPKIMTMVATDGLRYKMLLKGGNDDLRQDSIMEQVFEQVSNLLQDHRATRQRQLGIRTYKVLPLTQNAGVIEFVQNTIPLHEYSFPAHERYFPKDYKHNRCRKEISEAQPKPLPQRLQAYRAVTANFHSVLRYFFMEHFLSPDDWFARRLAYSRSTAAISMLGHVLGLGDRHGHNILLDEQTGEVVHIDLGLAFEAGRVLPVPEVVPFRLTRDIVDAMGISGVEGVFRRCCNFTLEALRQDQFSIMTILDVLRYDPLYSWSISPLRLQRMQENHDTRGKGTEAAGAAKRAVNEPSEADRALAVVAKKLGKTLSVEATVNELIQQATDERNLAVLYCGWAAYA